MQILLAATRDLSQLMFPGNPPLQSGLMREWAKVINLERPGIRGQAPATGLGEANWISGNAVAGRTHGAPSAAAAHPTGLGAP